MNPYNHNPWATNATAGPSDLHSDLDAHRALMLTARSTDEARYFEYNHQRVIAVRKRNRIVIKTLVGAAIITATIMTTAVLMGY